MGKTKTMFGKNNEMNILNSTVYTANGGLRDYPSVVDRQTKRRTNSKKYRSKDSRPS